MANDPARRSKWAQTRQKGILRYAAVNLISVCVPVSIPISILFSLLTLARGASMTEAFVRVGLATFLFTIPFMGILLIVSYCEEERMFKKKIRENRCTSCNYDLRGSVETASEECPECGCLIERLNS